MNSGSKFWRCLC